MSDLANRKSGLIAPTAIPARELTIVAPWLGNVSRLVDGRCSSRPSIFSCQLRNVPDLTDFDPVNGDRSFTAAEAVGFVNSISDR
jgi:hypothetical protein